MVWRLARQARSRVIVTGVSSGEPSAIRTACPGGRLMPELVSLVMPLFNEEECLPLLCREMTRLADRIERERGLRVETLLIDDGSSDRSWIGILDFARADPRV